MPIDPGVLSQLDTAAARGVGATAAFWEQHAAMIGAAAQVDMRLVHGLLAQQLYSGFEETVVQSKAAYDTPHPPGAAPLPSAPAVK